MMHQAVLGPGPESLSTEPEDDSGKTPERCQAHIGHDWRHISTLLSPSIDKLRESITPQILVDSYAHED